jgi:hypothetical protein
METRSRTVALALVASLLASGCVAARHVPIVDLQASPAAADGRDFNQDLFECQNYAESIDPAGQALAGAVAGALFNAALGAALGGIVGDAGLGAALGATSGGMYGAAGGAAQAEARRTQIVNNCMHGRGWNVL